jgi:hypothetical protein
MILISIVEVFAAGLVSVDGELLEGFGPKPGPEGRENTSPLDLAKSTLHC